MESKASTTRSWWLALGVMALSGPWPGWDPPWLLLLGAALAAGALARPRGRSLIPWLSVALALLATAPELGRRQPDPQQAAERLSRHCAGMLRTAESVAGDAGLEKLFAATGEITDPEMPFRLLEQNAAGASGRTVYLADDRALLVAWGGEPRAYPDDLRALGPRRWGLAWSARGVTLYLREPIILEGRLVGAVTVADHSSLEVASAFGIVAPDRAVLSLGTSGDGNRIVDPGSPPGVRLPLSVDQRDLSGRGAWLVLPWLVFCLSALALTPHAALPAVVLGGFSLWTVWPEPPPISIALLLLLTGASAGRLARHLEARWGRAVAGAAVATAGAACLVLPEWEMASWLPSHLLRPGWGGVWMVAVAWAAAGFWRRERSPGPTLMGRLALSAALAGLGVALTALRLPLELMRAEPRVEEIAVPHGDFDLDDVLPVASERCDLSDLAPALAERWGLVRSSVPRELRLIDREGAEISRWGELARVGEHVVLNRSWDLPEPRGGHLELWSATEPWSFVFDWRNRPARVQPLPYLVAVLTRSGDVAASRDSSVRALDAATAGELYHEGDGWALVHVGDGRRLAMVRRQGEWLLAAVARAPSASDWVVQGAVACLWALVGLTIAVPPPFRRAQLATFGGRLRLLVAGGVVVPLAVLTLFLHLRFQEQDHQRRQSAGLEALQAARYTVVHLGGGYAVDNELARWIAAGWGGEVVLFDGATQVAASRPDYMQLGYIPQLPAARAFLSYLLGRGDAVVLRHGGEMVAAGAVEMEGRWLLLELFRPGSSREAGELVVVDWLLSGAILAALLALALTSRIERRLSASLRDLVALARKLLQREPVGAIRRPPERDLAEVLDAVRSMNEAVQRRELSLRHQEELLRITLATLTQAVVVLEPGGEISFANPSAHKLQESHADSMFRTVDELAQRARAEDEPVVETVNPLPGQEVTWRVGVACAPLPDGRAGVVAVIDDISGMVRADRLRQLAQLARIVAHEVKNPLTPIRLWVQEVEEARRRRAPDLDDVLAEACSEISVQVDRLQEMAGSFSNLVALEKWEPSEVDLVELVRETVAGLAIVERRGVGLVLDVPDADGCIVIGDRQWLRRAVGNLLINSVEAVGAGDGEVVVAVVCDAERVILEVEDTGGGVPEQQLEELFSPHFSTTSAGSGLGLALVHNVVVRCQGEVSARNGDRGLVVRVDLPRCTSDTMIS